MDQNQHVQPTRGIGSLAPTNLPIQIVGPSIPSSYPIEQHYAHQHIYQPQQHYLQQQLNNFWARQRQEIEAATNLKTHGFPLSRIKKIMKTDKNVSMVSAEAPVVLAKACEMFILELSLKAWANVENNKRRTIKKSDIVSAISRTDVFDFLVDNIVPKDDTVVEHQVFAGIPKMGTATIENVPSYYIPPQQHVDVGLPYVPRMPTGNLVLDQNHHHELQIHPFPTTMGPSPNQQNHFIDLDD